MSLLNLAVLTGIALRLRNSKSNKTKFIYTKSTSYSPHVHQIVRDLNYAFCTTSESEVAKFTSPRFSVNDSTEEDTIYTYAEYFVLYTTIPNTNSGFNDLIFQRIEDPEWRAIDLGEINEINFLCSVTNLTDPAFVRVHLNSDEILNVNPKTLKIG
jgi:hypothetical protein